MLGKHPLHHKYQRSNLPIALVFMFKHLGHSLTKTFFSLIVRPRTVLFWDYVFYRPSCHRMQMGVAVRGSHLVQLPSDLGIFPATRADLQQMSIWQNLQAWVDLDKQKFPHLSTFVPKLIKERNILWNNLIWTDLEVWCSWLCTNIVLGLGYCITM